MKVIIDNDYWVLKQGLNFTLQKHGTRKGKDGEVREFLDDVGYFADLGGALARYAKEVTNDKFEGKEINAFEYLKELENVCKTILAQVIKQ